MIGVGDHVEVVLDEDDGGPVVDQPLQYAQEDADVERVQSDAGFVQDEQGVVLVAVEFGVEFEAPSLAAGQGGSGLAESEVAQAQVDESLQAGSGPCSGRRCARWPG
ncbi:hypothetical protein [Streptomyces sp. NPDC058295]|uniref:hypothetical protein n=1 Tax=Streptomyces sp. NPDC058295 TaxID=3346431 RepID=UPI0036E71D1E